MARLMPYPNPNPNPKDRMAPPTLAASAETALTVSWGLHDMAAGPVLALTHNIVTGLALTHDTVTGIADPYSYP